MLNQLTLFDNQSTEDIDIRTSGQINKKVAYDVGERVYGSKKELAALRKKFQKSKTVNLLNEMEKISPAVAAELITKKELFSDFSLEKEKERGTDAPIARLKQLMIQRIHNFPDSDSTEGRLAYMKASQWVLEKFEEMYTFDDFSKITKEITYLVVYEKARIIFLEMELARYKKEIQQCDPHLKEYKQLLKKINEFTEKIEIATLAKELKLSSLGDKWKKFFTKKQSHKTTVQNALKVESWDQLLEKRESNPGKKRKRKATWTRDLPVHPERNGGNTSPIEKPEDLIHVFRYKGIEFGHYLDDTIGSKHLIRSSEAMLDLADILGIFPTSLSLGGRLAMAYGSRGSGGKNAALAHYEPITKVINMTKERGSLGVYAHEWYHALDHLLYDVSHDFTNGIVGYASETDTIGTSMPSELKNAFINLMESIKTGESVGYFENTNKPGAEWRGSSFKFYYKRHNGNLDEAMIAAVQEINTKLEKRISLYNCYEQEIEKLQKKYKREIKNTALALAWYHEKITGERVEYIKYPTDHSNYLQASIKLDGGKISKYWSSDREMAARAFECYISDKLSALNRKNDYLVAGTDSEEAFPMGEERIAINQNFDAVMDLIKKYQLI